MNNRSRWIARTNWTKVLTLGVGFIAWSAVVLWVWNTIGADLFGLPTARFKHALALGVVVIAVWWPLFATNDQRRYKNTPREKGIGP